jgi:hypothetical protein
MKTKNPDNKPLLLLSSHLIVYEISFALIVIYYIQQGATWFKISFAAICMAELTAIIKTLSLYGKWNKATNEIKKATGINLLVNLSAVALYLFCLLVLANQLKMPGPPLMLISLTALPPIITFVLFLYSDTSQQDTNE